MDLLRKVSSSLPLLLLVVCLSKPPPAVALCDCQLTGNGKKMLCSGCSQDELPQTLRPGVARLALSGNRLTSLRGPQAAGSALASLTVLNADKNQISELRNGDTCAFRMLQVLDLSNNNLQLVEKHSIACNHHLKRLVLNDNPDVRLEDLQSHSLTHLFLERCDLRRLDPSFLEGLPALKHLYLRGNRLDCAAISKDLHDLRPQLRVYCDNTVATDAFKGTTRSSTISTTSASIENVPSKPAIPTNSEDIPDHPTRDTLPSQQSHVSLDTSQILIIISAVFLFVILLIFILFVIFLFHLKCRNEFEIGTANGKLLQDPC